MRILITCFTPFRGRDRNGSQALARFLKEHHQRDDVRMLEIPVRWGAVESVTSDLITSWQPDLILGIGEGGTGSIAIETIGRNIRQGEDVDGNLLLDEVILENGEPERKSRFSFAWSSRIHVPISIRISLDAGTYLCNNALYHYCGTGSKRVGFIHVPPQSNIDEFAYCELYGFLLLEILQQNTAI